MTSAPPPTCSAQWDTSQAPAWGTASHATFWVAIEQRGPWGRTALTGSRLDPDLGRRVEDECATAGGRALLIRRPGTPPRDHSTRQVVVAGGMPLGRPWSYARTFDGDGEADLAVWWASTDLGALASGDPACLLACGFAPSPAMVLVCTNGRRDVCCAVRGRPAAARAAELAPGRVWECTHTGGHRFAPTGIVLPTGQTLARLDEQRVVDALHAADDGRLATVDPRHHRGLAHLAPPLQAADGYVRHRDGLLEASAPRVAAAGDSIGRDLLAESTMPERDPVTVRVEHNDGRLETLRVTDHVGAVERATSCGGLLLPSRSFAVDPVLDDSTAERIDA